MVLDFSDLKKFVNTYIVDVLDHNYINDVIYNPTAENICFWIWAELSRAGLKGLSSIKVWEAPNSIAEITASMADAYARGLLLCK
jgi:6-pyruvoyltetrahydropterin/6-carboxytetrahydropterin synthase